MKLTVLCACEGKSVGGGGGGGSRGRGRGRGRGREGPLCACDLCAYVCVMCVLPVCHCE